MEDEEFDPNIKLEILPLLEVLKLMLESGIGNFLGHNVEALLSVSEEGGQDGLERVCEEFQE